MRKNLFPIYLLLLISLLFNAENVNAQKQKAKNTAEYDANIPKRYVRLINILIMKSGISPTSAARMHGYVGLTLYEAINTGSHTSSMEETVTRDYTHYECPPGSSWDDAKTKAGISVQPTWGKNRTFVKGIYAQTKPADPIPFSKDPNSDFYKQAMEVCEISRDLNFEKHLIAEYWKDDVTATYTPAGHTIHILVNALEKEKASLDKFAYAYAKTGITLNDAFICCWETKYSTNCIRPITYIKEAIDKQFKPSFLTPAFPEYTSGHSTQWGASAEILSSIFGNEYAFTDQTDYLRDKLVPRQFKSFEEAAQEASMSRIYGSIHFRQACDVGLEQGKRIGRIVNKLVWLK